MVSTVYLCRIGGSWKLWGHGGLSSWTQGLLLRERAQQHDEVYYMWALAFFMAFNRAASFQPGLVSETLSVHTFHFIEQNLTTYYEMMLTDRKEATSWAHRCVQWEWGQSGHLGQAENKDEVACAGLWALTLGGEVSVDSWPRLSSSSLASLVAQDAPGSEGLPGAAGHGERDGRSPRCGYEGEQSRHQE